MQCRPFVMPSRGIVGVELEGTLIGGQRLLVALEVAERVALLIPYERVIWPQFYFALISQQSLSRTFQVFNKDKAFFVMQIGVVGVQPDRLLVSRQRLFIAFRLLMSITLRYPLLFRLLRRGWGGSGGRRRGWHARANASSNACMLG
jgi:hypothetical protein